MTDSKKTFLAPAAPPQVEPRRTPTFSVIIAAHRAAGTIGETVASALDQTVPGLEVVCDDGAEAFAAPNAGTRLRALLIPPVSSPGRLAAAP